MKFCPTRINEGVMINLDLNLTNHKEGAEGLTASISILMTFSMDLMMHLLLTAAKDISTKVDQSSSSISMGQETSFSISMIFLVILMKRMMTCLEIFRNLGLPITSIMLIKMVVTLTTNFSSSTKNSIMECIITMRDLLMLTITLPMPTIILPGNRPHKRRLVVTTIIIIITAIATMDISSHIKLSLQVSTTGKRLANMNISFFLLC